MKAFMDWIGAKKGDLLNFLGPTGMLLSLAGKLGAFNARGGSGGGIATPSFAGIGQQALDIPGGPASPIMPVEAQGLNLAALTQGGQPPIRVTIQPQKIELDGREVAEIVWKHRLDRQARR
jgi:hypothetical protein